MQVAVPIPQPIGYLAADEYKLQLAFEGEWLAGQLGQGAASRPASSLAPRLGHYSSLPLLLRLLGLDVAGERFLTPWLLLIGRRAAQPPYIEVELLRSGDTIKSVGAQVRSLTEV